MHDLSVIEPIFLRDRLHVSEVKLLHGLVLAQLVGVRVRRGQVHVSHERLPGVHLVREEDDDRFLRLRRCVHAQVCGVVRRLLGGLETLERDVLASLQLGLLNS